MTFYVADGDQQRGPFPVNELRAQGVGPETLVWREGMAGWERADVLPELKGLFAPAIVAPVAVVAPVTHAAPAHVPAVPAAPAPDLQYQSFPTGGYAAGYANPPSSGLAVASMVLGILAVPFALMSFCLWWASAPLSILAVVLGHAARSHYRQGRAGGAGMAMAGLVCGYISLALTAIVMLMWASIFMQNMK